MFTWDFKISGYIRTIDFSTRDNFYDHSIIPIFVCQSLSVRFKDIIQKYQLLFSNSLLHAFICKSPFVALHVKTEQLFV